MASCGALVKFCSRCRTVFTPRTRLWVQNIWQKSPKRYFITASPLFVHCQTKEQLDLEAPDASKLGQEYLLKAASAQTADTVTTLLSQTAHSLIEAERRYKETVEVLIELLEFHLSVLGNKEEEDHVWDIILQGRARVERYDKHIKDLQMLFSCVQKLADASAETAFLAGSEFTSTSLGERLHNAQRHVDSAREQSQQIEMQLQEVQVHCIQAIAEHAEKQERKKKAAEEELLADESCMDDESAQPQQKPQEPPLDEAFN